MKVVNKNQDKKGRTHLKLFTLALILSIFIFLFGVLLGNYIATQQLNIFKQTEEKFLVYLTALEMRDSILAEEDLCLTNIKDLFEEKVKLGQMLTELERRLGKEDKQVMDKKEIYELLEIKTLQNLENIKQKCDKNFDIILFFYTNKKEDPKGSIYGGDDQGKILDQIVYDTRDSNGKETVFVLVFDANSNNLATKALMQKYNITAVPSLVINGNRYNYTLKDDIELIIQKPSL
ncbi:hypothetical protein J4465_02800 [Candidatus Pacearchaeota archaeon]|nr:hypothetical protein [Candidatus Pacearchaeota archaeon]